MASDSIKQENLSGFCLLEEGAESIRNKKPTTAGFYFSIGLLTGFTVPLFLAWLDALAADKTFFEALFLRPSPSLFVAYLMPFIGGGIAGYLGHQNNKLKRLRQGLAQHIALLKEENQELQTRLNTLLLEQERQLRFFRFLPVGGVFINGNSMTLNTRAEQILGYQRHELTTVADWFRILFQNEADFQERAYLTDRTKGFPTPILVTVKKKNGDSVSLEICRHHDEQGEVWIMNDLTHQLKIQNERNIKNEIIDKTSDEILILDASLNVLSQNRASEIKAGSLLKSPFLQSLPEDKRSPFEKQVLKDLQEKHFWHGQIQLLDTAGEDYPALLRLFTHFDPVLKQAFYSALITDLSEIEMERYKSLQIAKLATIGELAAGIGHEINNPLAILRVNHDHCLKLVENQAPYEKLQQLLSKQNSAIERITKIVEALRVYSRGESLHFELISVHQGIRETLNLIETMYSRQEIQLISELHASDDVIHGHLGQIQQVLMNLLSNARDALENRSAKRITISTRNEGPYFVLAVTDNGQGMDEKTKRKMFQPFFTTKPRGKGTGMGTGISMEIIRQHHGQLAFTSKFNEGTTFWFKIKTAASQNKEFNDLHTPPQAQKVLTTNTTKKTRALVVDDEPEIRDILRLILEKSGLEVQEAGDGTAAIELTKANHFDLIICDIQMPKLNGFEMLQEIRSDPHFNGKFILITGGIQSNRSNSPHPEVLESVDGFLRKPFSDDDLMETLKNLRVV